MKDTLKEYALLKAQEKEIKAKIDALQPAILETMESQSVDEIITDDGLFALGTRRTYTYPQNIQDIEADLKRKKEEAEAYGYASYTEKKYLLFRG